MKKEWESEYERAILSGDIANAKQIVRDNAQDIYLLKFFSGTKQQLDTMMSGGLWLSNAKRFNDPYDSLSLANVRSKLIYDRNNPQELHLAYEEYEKQVENNKVSYDIQSSIFVTCFSETSIKDLHMWNYYADEHKGFCAEYSLKKMIEQGLDILPVVYVKEWEADRTISQFSTQVSLIKSVNWKQEKEWRVVKVEPDKSQENGLSCKSIFPEKIYVGCRERLHISDNWDLFRELQKSFGDNPEVLNYVWKQKKQKVSLNNILHACEQNHLKKIPLFSMVLDERRFGLRERKIIY